MPIDSITDTWFLVHFTEVKPKYLVVVILEKDTILEPQSEDVVRLLFYSNGPLAADLLYSK